MGVDIHAYIELDETGEFKRPESIACVVGFYCLPRDYAIFDALANAHNCLLPEEDQNLDFSPLIPPRGMPETVSTIVGKSFYDIVLGQKTKADSILTSELEAFGFETIEEHEANVRNKDMGAVCKRILLFDDQVFTAVPKIGIYFPTWLNVHEFGQVISHAGTLEPQLPIQYRNLFGSLRFLSGELGAEHVRLVIWFDR